eukprot:XP_012820962.1 PREDICTED: uncharacterized protein LOC100486588 isoform X2 [Xenopus tropicalis]
MEKTDDDPLQETQFWCNVEESLKNNGAEKPVLKRKKRQFLDDPEPAVAGQTLDDLLRACKETEPALGLEYVYEYHQDESSYRAYECRLCNLQTGLAHMFMHVVGAKHRIAYLSKHHSTLGIPSTFQVKSSTKNKKLKDACFTVEKTFGRKSINIAKGSFEPRSFLDGPLPASALNYGTDNKLKQIDFTTDDFGDIDKKPSVSERVVTFRELKAQHEEKLKEAQVSVESEFQDLDDQEQELQDNEKDNKETGSDMEVCSMDLSECDPEEFFCNQELFDFLDTYKINKKEDVTFILKVTEKFSEVLVHHKKQFEEARKKALAEDEKRKTVELKLKAEEVQRNVEEKKRRAEEAQYTLDKRQGLQGAKRTAEEAKRRIIAVKLRSEEAKRTVKQIQQRNEMRRLNQNVQTRIRTRTRGRKKKFNAQQKKQAFLAKAPALNQRFLSTCSSNLNPEWNASYSTPLFPISRFNKQQLVGEQQSFQSTSITSQESTTRLSQNKNFAVSKFDSGKQTSERRLSAPHGPVPGRLQESSRLREGLRYPNVQYPNFKFGNNVPSNEPRSSCRSAPDQSQGRESSFIQYPRLPRPVNEPQSSAMPQSQWFSQMAPSNRDGHFQNRPQFPHEMQPEKLPDFSSRDCFPIGLNMPKNEATATFFATIKNMEVSDVISTLNAIAAKNPAFRGIHVPSLVKYLKDTGKLKIPHPSRSLSS